MVSLQPVQNLPETSQTLLKYEKKPGQVKTFLAHTDNNFIWPSSMPEHMRRHCFFKITDYQSNIDDVQIGCNTIFFYNVLDKGGFLGHENDWVTVYNQKIIEYGEKYSDYEFMQIFEKMPGVVQLPVNQENLPRSERRRMVKACVKRPGEPGLFAQIDYDFYDIDNNNKRYQCVIDTDAIASSGYGEGALKYHSYKMFEIWIGDDHNWSKWVQTKIAVWEADSGDQVEDILIGNNITDQLAYVYKPKSPLKFLDGVMKSELALLKEKNARFMAKITGFKFDKTELIKRVIKLEEKQLKNVVIKNLLHASCVNTFG
ncbi:hypothetical protein GLOIN_2v1487515 [Rhizophagus irregularis DAOM 181602=DAOM 197198]|uniref:Uncharacterized protein n=1 Tax=Rhizophagus irregularis (strain DAOM 181602 / DAOM 197198 / MUCL 43194) TaxID=747089 RepID=A0A2P4P376_RHIID|nr:hypothetical protein GLOIN_2v1487515 [Rhizophagus irregularis DAOM 181602=DAOM 197198]POG59830.1 hypothetical protein GLOIN_2v1487515 [Rhizophagus irregularis DAOM 181602=DAOM 197198]|eukprot:XP_025166696.1 hypothetical protein GLOIN_2v1487515 [Rhizophagus irregularis DAOM 181602=DAOM 197198]